VSICFQLTTLTREFCVIGLGASVGACCIVAEVDGVEEIIVEQ